jgi:hypothetical protein
VGTSFVGYKGFGFWTRDEFLEDWLKTLLDEMQKVPTAEEWQEFLMKHWRTQMSINGGCMSIGLDEFLADNMKKDFVLSVAKRALKHSNLLGRQTGELFINLLEGKLKTTVTSPIDYLNDPRADQAKPG